MASGKIKLGYEYEEFTFSQLTSDDMWTASASGSFYTPSSKRYVAPTGKRVIGIMINDWGVFSTNDVIPSPYCSGNGTSVALWTTKKPQSSGAFITVRVHLM